MALDTIRAPVGASGVGAGPLYAGNGKIVVNDLPLEEIFPPDRRSTHRHVTPGGLRAARHGQRVGQGARRWHHGQSHRSQHGIARAVSERDQDVPRRSSASAYR